MGFVGFVFVALVRLGNFVEMDGTEPSLVEEFPDGVLLSFFVVPTNDVAGDKLGFGASVVPLLLRELPKFFSSDSIFRSTTICSLVRLGKSGAQLLSAVMLPYPKTSL